MKLFSFNGKKIELKTQYPALAALLAAAEVTDVAATKENLTLTAEQAEALNEALTGANANLEAVEAARDVAEAQVKAVTGAFGEAAKAEGFKAEAAIATLQADLQAMTKERDDLQAEVKELGGKPGATHSNPGKTGDDDVDDPDAKSKDGIDYEAEHYDFAKRALGLS